MPEAAKQTPEPEQDTLTLALIEAYDAAESEGDEKAQSEATPDGADEQAEAQAGAEAGDADAEDSADDAPDDEPDAEADEAEDEGDEAEDSDAPDEEQEDGPGEATDEPPVHWSEGDKATFKSLPKEGQEFLLRRHKEMEADYTRKTTEIAPLRKALDPFRPEMERLGIPEAQAMQHITSAAQQFWQYQQALQQNPKAAIAAIAKQFGVELGGEQEQDTYLDPAVNTLMEKVNGFEQKLTQREQAEQQQQQAAVQARLQEFAKDHPYFDDLRVTMGALMDAAIRRGESMTMDDAYEQAQWSHPDIRTKILAEQQAKSQKANEQKRKEKVKAARKNGAGISTKAARKEAPAPKSIGDELREQFNRTE